MAESTLRLKVESQQYEQKLKRATASLVDMANKARQSGASFAYADKEEVAFVRSLGELETSARNVKGKMGELGNTIHELSQHYRQLTQEEKNSPYGVELNNSIRKLTDRYKELKGGVDETQRSMQQTGGALDQIAGKFGLSAGKAGALGAALAAAGVAAKVAKDAFMASEANIDEWGRSVEGAKGAYNVFIESINGGNWDNFLGNLSRAIQGARELYDAMDRMSSVKGNNQSAIAILQDSIQAARLKLQKDPNNKSLQEQIKKMTARLAELQKEGSDATKNAGRKQMFETLRNYVDANNKGKVRVSDAAIYKAIDNYIRGGQGVMDAYSRNARTLYNKGYVAPHEEQYIAQTGQTYSRTVGGGFDIRRLSIADQMKYLIAMGMTQKETELQKGNALYAQGVQDSTMSHREEFKGNKYAGAGGSGSSGPKASQEKVNEAARDALLEAFDSLGSTAEMESLRNSLMDQYESLMAGPKISSYDQATGRTRSVKEYMDYYDSLIEGLEKIREKMDSELGEFAASDVEQITQSIEGLKAWQSVLSGQATAEAGAKQDRQKERDEKRQATAIDRISKAASGISSVASGIQQIGVKVPAGVQQALNVMQGLMSVIQGVQTVISVFSTGAETANTIALGVNTAAIGALTAAVSVNSATNLIPFAGGGQVPCAAGGLLAGNSLSGDRMPVRVNSGELILNRAQQASISQQLTGGGMQNLRLSATIAGEDIRLALDNNSRRRGRGEYVTTRG